LWLQDEKMLAEMSRNALKEGSPHAASDIVLDIGEITQRWIQLNQQHQLEILDIRQYAT